MEEIKWTEDLSVNNQIIDNQHKKLFKIVNKIIASAKDEKNPNLYKIHFNDLIEYTQTHFKDEESLLKSHNYPKIEEHIKVHKQFVRKIADFYKDILMKNFNVRIEMTEFLTGWWVNHVSTSDQDYKKYI